MNWVIKAILYAGIVWGVFRLLDYWWKRRSAKKGMKKYKTKKEEVYPRSLTAGTNEDPTQKKPDARIIREKIGDGKVKETYEKDGQVIEVIKDENDKPIEKEQDKEVQLASANVVQSFYFK